MLHEFALDPHLICDRNSARYFFDACKPEKGRLISQFPKRWKKLVYEHCKSVVPHGTSLKYIEERLCQLDGTLIRTGRNNYDPEKDWVVNAVASHQEYPFRAIVSPNPGPEVLGSDVDEDTPEWKTAACITAHRSATKLTEGCGGLLRNAKELMLVDPYFDGAGIQMKVLKALLNEALQRFPLSRIEYHVKERIDSNAYKRRLNAEVLKQLPTLPVPLHIIRWQDGDETLHDRYILTDLAGVSIPQGLSECRAEESDTTEISLLSQEVFERRRAQYSAKNAGCFKFVDGWKIENGSIAPIIIKNGEWCVDDS